MHGTSALTRRRIVATFDTFGEAQATMECLQDADLGTDHATILAEGLRLVGRSRDRSVARPTIVLGAATGAVIGILLASTFALFAVPAPSFAAVVLVGLVVGLAVGSASGGSPHGSSRYGVGRCHALAWTRSASRWSSMKRSPIARSASCARRSR